VSARISARERCSNHLAREAVARCPECRRFLCRECATEHDGRIICSICVGKLHQARSKEGLGRWPADIGLCLLGLIAAWFFFYIAGQTLLSIPSSFHEGSVWREQWLERE
jgi:hypothetical protein